MIFAITPLVLVDILVIIVALFTIRLAFIISGYETLLPRNFFQKRGTSSLILFLFTIIPIIVYLILRNKGVAITDPIKLSLLGFQIVPLILFYFLNRNNVNIGIEFKKNAITKWIYDLVTNKDLLSRIGITIAVIVIYRALANIPLPGIDMKVYTQNFGKSTASEINYFFSVFTGGRLETPSLVGLGIAAYINASIIMQILPYAIPRLKEIQKDGERGKQIINQITRFITLPLGIIYSIGYVYIISSRDLSTSTDPAHKAIYLVSHTAGTQWPTLYKTILMVLILTAGTILLMWLSEFVTERGLGNGSSLIITIGILSSLPVLLTKDFSRINLSDISSKLIAGNFTALNNPLTIALIATIIGFVLVIAGIVFINESSRNIPIQYARRIRGEEIGKGSSLPIKFTLTGVLPVIFTYSILYIPQVLVPILERVATPNSTFFNFLESLKTSFLFSQSSSSTKVDQNTIIYAVVYFLLVIIFGLFYGFIVLNPQETSENLQKSGAFIPNVRPGKSTEKYITGVLLRISLIGAIFLALIAEIPIIARDLILSSSGQSLAVLSGIGGTSILIIVTVLLDTYRQYRSLQATRNYERYILLN